MSTRAQDHQSEINKQKHLARPKRAKRPAPMRTHAQQRTDGETAVRHVSQHAARKASTVLEESLDRPTRKSTRISANRAKRTTNLQLKAQRKVIEPRGRHDTGH
jgi:hypothetical protein